MDEPLQRLTFEDILFEIRQAEKEKREADLSNKLLPEFSLASRTINTTLNLENSTVQGAIYLNNCIIIFKRSRDCRSNCICIIQICLNMCNTNSIKLLCASQAWLFFRKITGAFVHFRNCMGSWPVSLVFLFRAFNRSWSSDCRNSAFNFSLQL